MKYLLYFISAILTADTAILIYRGSFTLGLYIMILLSAAFVIISVYYDRLKEITRKGLGKLLKIGFVCGLSFVVASGTFIMYKSQKNVTYNEDAVIVLGCGLKTDGTPAASLKLRLDGCIDYYSKNNDCYVVVSGGYDRHSGTAESESMKEYLVENGIPSEKILCEDKSENTRQNFEYSLTLLEENGIPHNSVAFITSNYHIYRASINALQSGFKNITKLPVWTDIIAFIPSLLREICAVMATLILHY